MIFLVRRMRAGLVPQNVPFQPGINFLALDLIGDGTASWPCYRRDGDGGEGEQEIRKAPIRNLRSGRVFFSENDERGRD